MLSSPADSMFTRRKLKWRLTEFPGVLESAVIGVPHADLGEGVTAIVVLKSGHNHTG